MAKPGKKRKILFVIEIIVLLLFIGGLYVYGQISTKLDKIEQPVLDETKIVTNEQAPVMTGYSTYALFGIDHRDKNAELGAENSDTIIIASVNNDTKDVKLVSIYRDTLLNIGNDTYAKANAAYAYGGPEQAISMLNTNLDLNITGYATIDFNALVTVIDLLGGLEIPLSYAEIEHMNNYCVETSKETGKSYTPVEKPDPKPEDEEAILDVYHLNGVQATSYCRIRYTASLDMGRTERQRRVLQMIVDKAKRAGLTTIFNIMDEVFPMVQTSLNKTQILQMAPSMIGYSMNDTTGFPMNYKFSDIKGSIIVPTTLESNVIELHKFLYGEDGYTPSQEVLERSEKILKIVGGEEQLKDEAPVVTEDTENTEDDTFIWQDTSGGDSGYTDYDTGGNDYTGGGDSGGNDYTGGGDAGGNDYTGGGDTGGNDYTGGDGNTGGGDTGGSDNTGGDDYTGGGDTGGSDNTGGGDTGGSDNTGGGDTGGNDYTGGDGNTGGGDTGGSDNTGGGDTGGSDNTGGGDTGGSDNTGGGDVGGGDTGGGDVGGGEPATDSGGGAATEPVVEE